MKNFKAKIALTFLFSCLIIIKEGHTMEPKESLEGDSEGSNVRLNRSQSSEDQKSISGVRPSSSEPSLEGQTSETKPIQTKNKKKKRKKKKRTDTAPHLINSNFPPSSQSETGVTTNSHSGAQQAALRTWQHTDDKGRTIKEIISIEEFDKLNQEFSQINSLLFNKSKAEEIKEEELSKLLKQEENENKSKDKYINFFSLIDGEGVFFQGTMRQKAIPPYFVMTGIHNCVGVTLYGRDKSNKNHFSAIVHVARDNNMNSLDEFLNRLSKFSNKRITLRAMYKTKTLLDVFTYIKNKNFAIEYVYVNDAHHSVNDNEISIVYTLRQ